MTSTYQTLEEVSTQEESGDQGFTTIPLPQVGYPNYNRATSIGRNHDQYRPAYRTRLAIKLGILQIVFGTLAIIFGSTILVMRVFLYFTGMGIGAGAVFTAAGVFGVVSSRQKATWAIVTCMVLSIVSAVAAGVAIIVSLEGIDLHYKVDYHPSKSHDVDTGIIMHIVLIICCGLELLVSVLQATSCCRATCCMSGNSRPDIMVVYLPQPVMSTNQQFGGTSMPTQAGQVTLSVQPPGGGEQQQRERMQNGGVMNGSTPNPDSCA